MRELIQGAYDLHVHTAPDVLPRRLDDFEMAQRVMDSGMAGFAMITLRLGEQPLSLITFVRENALQ